MRVAFLCNVHNTFFPTVRHLRDRGVAADLLTIGIEGPYADPAFDSFDLSYRGYTKRLKLDVPERSSLVDVAPLKNALAGYDALVACGPVPGFLHRAGLRLDAFYPYGDDLLDMPLLRMRAPRRGAIRSVWEFPKHQRRGIREARWQLGSHSSQMTRALDRVHAEGKRVALTALPVYTKQIGPEVIAEWYDRSAWYKEFRRIREQCDVLVMHHGRQEWRVRGDGRLGQGSDLFLRAFAKALPSRRDRRVTLVCFEFGGDLQRSRQLVHDLGIGEYVRWMPFMARKDALVGLSLGDLAVSSVSDVAPCGGPAMEALALAKPLFLLEREGGRTETRFPAMTASTENDMEERFTSFLADPDMGQSAAKQAFGWFEQKVISEPLSGWERLFRGPR